MQRKSEYVVNTFTKGLITEAGEMTFPTDATIDELNCDLRRDSTRRRRKAVTYEDDFALSSFSLSGSDTVATGEWLNVGGATDKEYLVVQRRSTLFFYEKSDAPFSSHEKTVSVSLASFESVGTLGSANYKCEFESINGLLIVASPAIDTFFVKENTDGTLSTGSITFRVRDFQYQTDKRELINGELLDDVSQKRKYDTANSGWVGPKGEDALDTYTSVTTETEFIPTSSTGSSVSSTLRGKQYPPLILSWFSGKNSSGNFSLPDWAKIQGGTSLIGNGHFILDFFFKNRSLASGISGLSVEKEDSRFSTVCSAFGRVFYSGISSEKHSGTILFSPVLEAFNTTDNIDATGLGDCFQVNDPTSEDLSDLLDTDGGVIRIPDAIGIRKLQFSNNSLFVFADNGVWAVKGVDDVFTATSFGILKVSNIGIVNKDTFIDADGTPFWWSDYGIHTLGFDQNSLQAKENNLSITTIQTFYDNISLTSRLKAISCYDEVNKKVFWFYPDNVEPVSNKFNNILILDIPLQSFYPWRVKDTDGSSPYIVGAVFYRGFGFVDQNVSVVSGDDLVVTSTNDEVIINRDTGFVTGDPVVVLLVRDVSNSKLTMALFSGNTFLDWGEASYSSFAKSGYNFLGDAMVRKNAPYIDLFLRRTEEGFVGSEESGYDIVHDSSIVVKSFWDFKKSSASSGQQGYRRKDTIAVDPLNLDAFDARDTVIKTRLKIRGSGRSMYLSFESEEGKDFILIGFGHLVASNGHP